MSNINGNIPNEAVIPVFESRIFEDHEDSRFALGIIGVGCEVVEGREEEFTNYLRLRANVYAEQTGMISPELVRADGTEVDEDDARSVHFGLFEQHEDGVRTVGAMRLIIKTEQDDRLLPIEDFFPDAFDEGKAPIDSTEASRYISRHESGRLQKLNGWMLMTAAVAYIENYGLTPTYAVIEPPLEQDFRIKGMPIKGIADPKFVPEYNADNLGVRIDTTGFAEVLEERQPGKLAEFQANEGGFIFYGRHIVKTAEPDSDPRLVGVAA